MINFCFCMENVFMKNVCHWGLILSFFMGMGIPTLNGQTTINGRVLDASSESFLSNVEVVSSPSQQLAFTNEYGQFSIKISEFPSRLIFRLAGYDSLVLPLNEDPGFLSIPLEINEYQLQEVVMDAYFSGRKWEEQAGGISMITKQDLKRGNETLITPALNRVPGVYMHTGAYNTNRITIRGIGARSLFATAKIRAYLDNIPLTTGDGETTIEDIDLDLIDRAEIIKGPASSVYGAGLGGTINLTTPRPEFKQTTMDASTTVGSYGLMRSTSNYKYSSGQSTFQINGNYLKNDGYRENNNLDRKGITALSKLYAGEKSSISVIGSFIDQFAQIPSSIDSTDFADEPRSAAFTWNKTQGYEDYQRGLAGISSKHQFNPGFSSSLGVFTSFRRNYEVRPFDILKENTQTAGTRILFSSKLKIAKRKFHLQMGGETFNEWYDWQTYENVDGVGVRGAILSDNEEVRRYINLFTQGEWELSERTILTAGLNTNKTQYTYTDLFLTDSMDASGDYAFEWILSPRIAINHLVRKGVHVHISASHGFSPPSLSETLTPDGTINPDIQPERGWNYEVGTRGALAKGRLRYDLTIYSMQIRDLLVARRTDNDQFVGVNAGKTAHNGLELGLNYQLIQQRKTNVQLFATYTYARYRFVDFVDEENDYSGNELTGTPPHLLNLGVDVALKPGIYGNLNYQYVAAMPMRDDNSVYSDSYSLVNAKIGYQQQIWNKLNLDFFIGINNLLDEKYASMILVNAGSFGGSAPRYFYPGLPRNFYGGAKVGYRF